MSTFEEILDKNGKLIYKTKGSSMKPMLYQDRDLVVLNRPRNDSQNMMWRCIEWEKGMLCTE